MPHGRDPALAADARRPEDPLQGNPQHDRSPPGGPDVDRPASWTVLTLHKRWKTHHLRTGLLRSRCGTPAGDWASLHDREVDQVKAVIARVNGLQPADPNWRMLMSSINAMLARHIMEEELDIFPRVDQVWGPPRRELAGQQMQGMLDPAAPGALAGRRALQPVQPRPSDAAAPPVAISASSSNRPRWRGRGGRRGSGPPGSAPRSSARWRPDRHGQGGARQQPAG